MVSQQVQEVIAYLDQVKGDPDANKRFKEKASEVTTLLAEGSNLAVEKALHLLGEMSSLDLSSHHRTQVWDVISMLESTKAD